MTLAKDGKVICVPWWLWPNLLGLDAPSVAVTWQYFFAEAFRVKIPISNYLTLFLVVWVIYSVDRLLDARLLKNPGAASTRHYFYHSNYRLIGFLTLIITSLTVVLCLTVLPGELVKFGLFVSLFVVVYFAHRIWVKGLMMAVVPKEVFVGMVFAVGTTLTGHTWSGEVPDSLWSPSVIGFGVLCSLNCLAISVWERSSDQHNDPNALPQLFPEVVKLFPAIACTVSLAAAAYALSQKNNVEFPILLSVASGCALIGILSLIAGKASSCFLRLAADVAVIVPALVLLPLLPWALTV